jgi:hypothetical protein
MLRQRIIEGGLVARNRDHVNLDDPTMTGPSRQTTTLFLNGENW